MLTGRRAFHARQRGRGDDGGPAGGSDAPRRPSAPFRRSSRGSSRTASRRSRRNASRAPRDLGFALTAWEPRRDARRRLRPISGPRGARRGVDRRSAVPQHERRRGGRVLQRRHHGGDHQRALRHRGAAGRGAHLLVRLQGQGHGLRQIGRAAGRAHRARGQRAQGRPAAAHHGAAHRRRDGYHLWSERYDREMEDVFAVQDEIARAIAEALQVRLAGGRTRPAFARRRRTSSPTTRT